MVAVKICGVRTMDAALVCAELGVDFVGFNFVPASRRAVDVQRARGMRLVLGGTHAVGVFRDESLGSMCRVVDTVGLDWIQLHGDETPDTCTRMREYGVGVIKAIPISEHVHDLMRSYHGRANILLIDAPVAGSGTPWPWDRLASYRYWFSGRNGTAERPKVFIAGGLTHTTVGLAIAAIEPDGVDVASGVESAGEIDIARVRAFYAAVHAHATTQYEPHGRINSIRSLR
jgi:phosphoribosylanthranilate isomerase